MKACGLGRIGPALVYLAAPIAPRALHGVSAEEAWNQHQDNADADNSKQDRAQEFHVPSLRGGGIAPILAPGD